MSDLISRKAVIDYIREQHDKIVIEQNQYSEKSNDTLNGMKVTNEAFNDFIMMVPAACDVEKVVEILDKEAHMLYSLQAFEPVKAWRNEYLIPIVKAGGEVSLMDVVKGAVKE